MLDSLVLSHQGNETTWWYQIAMREDQRCCADVNNEDFRLLASVSLLLELLKIKLLSIGERFYYVRQLRFHFCKSRQMSNKAWFFAVLDQVEEQLSFDV